MINKAEPLKSSSSNLLIMRKSRSADNATQRPRAPISSLSFGPLTNSYTNATGEVSAINYRLD
jgi:hypothetical protein